MTFIGKLGDIISHLDEAKFNQVPSDRFWLTGENPFARL
jgi:hypothetical protein